MQPVELDVGGNVDAPQNLGLHVVQREFGAEYGGSHAARLRSCRSNTRFRGVAETMNRIIVDAGADTGEPSSRIGGVALRNASRNGPDADPGAPAFYCELRPPLTGCGRFRRGRDALVPPDPASSRLAGHNMVTQWHGQADPK
jgi:hypothetical protein